MMNNSNIKDRLPEPTPGDAQQPVNDRPATAFAKGVLGAGLYPLSKKAYEIHLDRLDEGYLSDSIICYAENINKAKSILLKKIQFDGWKLKWINDEITYLNIPVRRSPDFDIYHFEEKELTVSGINAIIKRRERIKSFEDMIADENIKFCYIKKGPYYRPNGCGYTDFAIYAGIYPKAEAVSHARSVDSIILVPINISEHNRKINEAIVDLNSRLL